MAAPRTPQHRRNPAQQQLAGLRVRGHDKHSHRAPPEQEHQRPIIKVKLRLQQPGGGAGLLLNRCSAPGMMINDD